jgi:hypothetical protein
MDFKWVSNVIPFDLPSNYLESVDLTFNNIKVGEGIYGGSGFSYYPGAHDVASFSATFYEDDRCTALKWVEGWKAKIKNFSTGAYEMPSNYKRTWTITLLNTKNEPVLNAKLEGVWPSNTGNFALNYTSNGRLVLTQEFSKDNMVLEFLK